VNDLLQVELCEYILTMWHADWVKIIQIKSCKLRPVGEWLVRKTFFLNDLSILCDV